MRLSRHATPSGQGFLLLLLYLFICVASCRAQGEDYYSTLGLSKSATAKEIKTAYRRLALKYHPDKVDDEEKEAAERSFVKVSEAYAVLGDEKTRSVYDKHGLNGLKMLEQGIDPNAFGSSGRNAKFSSSFGEEAGESPFTFKFSFGRGDAHGSSGSSGQGRKRSFQFSFGADDSGTFDPFHLFEEMFTGEGASWSHKSKSAPRSSAKELFPRAPDAPYIILGSPKFPNATSKHIWFVTFYANDVKECISTAPYVKSVAKTAKKVGTFKVGVVNCKRDDMELEFCRGMLGRDVDDLPFFAMVVNGEVKPLEADIDGVPSAKDLYGLANDNIPYESVFEVERTTDMITKLMVPSNKDEKMGAILLITEKAQTSPLYASLAHQHRNDFIFGESLSKSIVFQEAFNVISYPLIVALRDPQRHKWSISSDEEEWVYADYGSSFQEYAFTRYDGQFKGDNISAWIGDIRSMMSGIGARRKEKKKSEEASCEAVYS